MAATGKAVKTMLMSIAPVAHNAPIAKSMESPGKNGATTKPTSQKIIKVIKAYIQTSYLSTSSGSQTFMFRIKSRAKVKYSMFGM
jgi:hypothetical protein